MKWNYSLTKRVLTQIYIRKIKIKYLLIYFYLTVLYGVRENIIAATRALTMCEWEGTAEDRPCEGLHLQADRRTDRQCGLEIQN